ncbi:hypothetical protein [Actinomycetospora sp. TBRC 11914]|nr:hypothetical protein [Actinomycetospora sp. TBRC 11914]NMO89190.1 hypothetical protein [Actinomycetospora sp. TBRC 11914]
MNPASPLGGTRSTPWSANAVKLHGPEAVRGAVRKLAGSVVVPSGMRKR